MTVRQASRVSYKTLAALMVIVGVLAALSLKSRHAATTAASTAVEDPQRAATVAFATSPPAAPTSAAPAKDAKPAAETIAASQQNLNELPSQSKIEMRLGIGDRMRLNIYEILERDADKWKSDAARMRPSAPAVELRTELSGEYAVDETGRLTVPAIGTFLAMDRSVTTIETEIADEYKRRMGRSATVLLSVLERSPIYIMGNVKTPGVYKFTPGITVLHAVTLAGGLGQANADVWQTVEYNRESEQFGFITQVSRKAHAELAVLKAERYKSAIVRDPATDQLFTPAEFQAAIAEEQALRHPVVEGRLQKLRALTEAVKTATKQAEGFQSQAKVAEDLAKLQEKRFADLKSMHVKYLISNTRFMEAGISLSTAREQEMVVRNNSLEAGQRLAVAKQAIVDLAAQNMMDLDKDIKELTQKVTSLKNDLAISQKKLASLAPGAQPVATLNGGPLAPQFQMIRRGGAGEKSAPALVPATTELQAGDLIVVIGGAALADGSPKAEGRPQAARAIH